MNGRGPEWRRYCLTIAYDGLGFEGWQSQPGGNTVQDTLDRAIAAVCANASGAQGAGRTDSGVHALGQVAHFDAPATLSMDAAAWQRALNTHLPRTVRVMGCRPVRGDFHARFSAIGKIYRYEWFTGPVLSPLRAGRAWHVRRCPDESLVRRAAALFEGTHDFAGFAANRGEREDKRPETVRRMDRVEIRRDEGGWSAEFEGEGFLYKMVRLLVGALVRCGQGKYSLEDLQLRLEQPGKSTIAPLAAPAEGLYLVEVLYDERIDPGFLTDPACPGSGARARSR